MVNEVGEDDELTLERGIDELVQLVAERNLDFYDVRDGNIVKLREGTRTRRRPAAVAEEGPSLDDLLKTDEPE